MLAIDTNVVVRFLTGDHPEQSATALALIEREDVFVTSTVLMETEWVLRSAYGLDKDRVIQTLTQFAGLPRLVLDEPARVATALAWAAEGMDFADALHLAAAENCDAFLSFDRRRVKAAAKRGGPTVRTP
jgi:predicted nucleic acid-binding protein